MKREVTNLEGLLVMLLLVAGVIITLLFTGCANISPRERFYIGQGADLMTTHWALDHQEGFYEKNPAADTTHDVFVLKLGLVALVEALAHADPERANLYYNIGGIMGYVPAAWNVRQMAVH